MEKEGKSSKEDKLNELLIEIENNIAAITVKKQLDENIHPREKQKVEEIEMHRLEYEQHFKVEDLERYLEENKKARDEKRWNVYREQMAQQLQKNSLDSEAKWLMRDDEKWKRCQEKIIGEIEKFKTRGFAQKVDDGNFTVYRKEEIKEINREENAFKVKAEKVTEDKRWEEYKKQMLRKESDVKASANRPNVDDIFSEFEEVVQSKRTQDILENEDSNCSISQRSRKAYLAEAEVSSQNNGCTVRRQLPEIIERANYLSIAKSIIKAEKLENENSEFRKIVAREKGENISQRVKEVDIALDQIFLEFHEVVESKVIKEFTEERDKQLDEQLKLDAKKRLAEKERKIREGPRPIDDTIWAEYKNQMISELKREEAAAIKRSAAAEFFWENIKKMAALKEREENTLFDS